MHSRKNHPFVQVDKINSILISTQCKISHPTIQKFSCEIMCLFSVIYPFFLVKTAASSHITNHTQTKLQHHPNRLMIYPNLFILRRSVIQSVFNDTPTLFQSHLISGHCLTNNPRPLYDISHKSASILRPSCLQSFKTCHHPPQPLLTIFGAYQ